MSQLTNKAWLGDDAQPLQPCSKCEATAERDAQILEILQTIKRVFNETDGFKNPWVKLARCKKAFNEIVRLMEPQVW